MMPTTASTSSAMMVIAAEVDTAIGGTSPINGTGGDSTMQILDEAQVDHAAIKSITIEGNSEA